MTIKPLGMGGKWFAGNQISVPVWWATELLTSFNFYCYHHCICCWEEKIYSPTHTGFPSALHVVIQSPKCIYCILLMTIAVNKRGMPSKWRYSFNRVFSDFSEKLEVTASIAQEISLVEPEVLWIHKSSYAWEYKVH